MMKEFPILQTERLVLRQFFPEEAVLVRELAGSPDIAYGCMSIPHPYGIGMAELWIACHETWFSDGSQLVLAVTRKSDKWLIGAVSLTFEWDHARAEIGYWIGVPYWSCGYATEAVKVVIAYAFENLMIHRITASYFTRNQASGKVLEKLGMHQEGVLRKHLLKEGIYEDVIICGILRDEWISESVDITIQLGGEL